MVIHLLTLISISKQKITENDNSKKLRTYRIIYAIIKKKSEFIRLHETS